MRFSPVFLFAAILGLSMTGCVINPNISPTPTPIALPTSGVTTLIGSYAGNVTISSVSTYSDETPTVTTNTVVPTTLVYNFSNVLSATCW
jgi:hypothetical protein